MKSFIAITTTAGLALTVIGAANLKRSDEGSGAGLAYHHNPLAIHESAYGMLLAELSQNTVDEVWHLGIEQVNPASHSHGPGEHHDHDHGDHHGHDHGDHGDHAHAGHDDDHHGHDHGDHDHDHDRSRDSKSVSLVDAITSAKDFLVDLKSAGYERTNPTAVSKAHRKHIAAEIEQMLLRSYKMDPTNYGVYNAYYLFLTAHELRSSPAAYEHARKISHHTIARAKSEDTAPGPWLTAEMALLNLFLLDQHEWREKGIDPPVERLIEYRDFSAYCKQQYLVLKQRAIADGRWETISAEKREEMDTRQYFAGKTFEQFDVLIARYSQPMIDPKTGLPNVVPQLPVASSPDDEATGQDGE